MRRIRIDFLAPEPARGRAVRWLRSGLWLTVITFATWELNFARQLLVDNESLNAAAASAARIPAGERSPGMPSGDLARTRDNKPWLDPSLLAGAERAIGRVPQSGTDLRLEGLVVDANRRLLVVRGHAARPQTADDLATELRAEFPQAKAGFPNVRNVPGRAEFEIGLQFPQPGSAP